MNIRAFAATLDGEFYKWGTLNSYPRVPTPYIDVLDVVQGMTTPSNMHLLNLAVRQLAPDECYLEVGTWRGSTFIGALLGNDAQGIAIDNDVMDEHDGDGRSSRLVWAENVDRFIGLDRARYIDASVPEVWDALDTPPVGVYLFDGDKSTDEAAYQGLVGVLPYLADEALIVVDDCNELNIRKAVHRLQVEAFPHLMTIMDIPTPGNCWPCFWNGLMVIAWKR